MKKTKIVATIGPASDKIDILEAMIREGMNVCRLNFSHGDYAWHQAAVKKIRMAEKHTGKRVAIMADIQGPRIRAAIRKNLVLKKGDKVFITDQVSPPHKEHKKELILDWQGFHQFVHRRDTIFIEDGLIQIAIEKREKNGCVGTVTVPGTVKPHKGVNIPSISDHMGFLTDKDIDDLEFILKQDVDFIAVSFVASSQDLKSLRHIIQYSSDIAGIKKRKAPWIISKIERRKAIANLDEVIEHSDGVMVARGDLAIEMPQEKVALMQKDIVRRCLKKKKPVIVATQMMSSMLSSARPTRAEIADVTNAVIDNTDAVMLSNETAMGAYPVETIRTMTSIIEETEKSTYNDQPLILRNKFAKLLFSERKKKRHLVRAENLKDALEFSSLRQEDIKVSLAERALGDRRKAELVWGIG